MANSKMSEFVSVTTVAGTDEIPCVQDNTNKKVTVGQLKSHVNNANYIYVCVATNTWRRSALSSW